MSNQIDKRLTKLWKKLIDNKEEISQADRMHVLIKIQQQLLSKKKGMVDFEEPILFLIRRTGDLQFFDNATKGKFIFVHSDGTPRTIELRPQDQLKFDYGDRKVRCYIGHEDKPLTGIGDSLLDTQSVAIAMGKVNATNQKLEEAMMKESRLKMAGWVKISLAIAAAIFIVIMGIGMFGDPIFKFFTERSAQKAAQTAVPALPGIFGLFIKKLKFK